MIDWGQTNQFAVQDFREPTKRKNPDAVFHLMINISGKN